MSDVPRKINERGISNFLVEQNVHQTLAISDYGYLGQRTGSERPSYVTGILRSRVPALR